MERYCHLFLLFFVMSFLSMDAKGQCIAETRNDTALCTMHGLDTISLGGSPTVSGGVPPYDHSWSTSESVGTTTYSASFFLNDTTVADPELHHEAVHSSLTFHLTVSDAAGNTCHDSLEVAFCSFGILTGSFSSTEIQQGDTGQIHPSVGSAGCDPLSYQWSPDYNISDPTTSDPQVWPDTSTTYSAVVTDSAGCETVDTFQVHVETASIEERGLNPRDVRIHPNPMKERSTIRIEHPDPSGMRMEFYDASGRKVDELPIEGEETRFQRKGLESGIYFYRLFDEQRAVEEGKLILR